MKPIVQLFKSTTPTGVLGKWDRAKAAAKAMGVFACGLIGALAMARDAGFLPEQFAGPAISALVSYALFQFGLKQQDGTRATPPGTPDDGPDLRSFTSYDRAA